MALPIPFAAPTTSATLSLNDDCVHIAMDASWSNKMAQTNDLWAPGLWLEELLSA